MSGLSVGFISLGCAKNLVDSEHMATVLKAAHVRLAPSPETADVILINTCGFIGDAKRESIDTILRTCALKETGGCRAVIVAGCLIQRYRDALRRALPEVDAFIGLDEIGEIASIVRKLERGESGLMSVSRQARKVFSPLPDRILLTGGPFAYVKIAEGCNHRCAFCAIPGIRGRYRSRPIPDIVRESGELLARGIRELNLISQDTTRYGHDLGDGTDLPRLLRALGGLGGQFRIRLLYGHPAHVTDELLDTMGEVSQVCRYLDVPIQHSHPEVLHRMRRAGGAAAVRSFPERARRRLPGVTLRTTCLVGFPGERPEHFRDLEAFIGEARFDHLGVFVFSKEDHTAAADLPGSVPAVTASRRRARLMRLQQAVVFGVAQTLAGRETDVMLIRRDGKRDWIARGEGQAPEVDGVTRVRGVGPDARPGTFLRVRLMGGDGYDLQASVLRG